MFHIFTTNSKPTVTLLCILVYWPPVQRLSQKPLKEKVTYTPRHVLSQHLHFADENTARDHRMDER